MNRRELLVGAAAAVPVAAHAGEGWTEARVLHALDRVRAGMARAADRLRRNLQRAGAVDTPLGAACLRAAPTMFAYGALHDLPLVAQAHPAGQAFVRGVARELGGAARDVRDALAELELDALDPAGLDFAWSETTDGAGELGPAQVRFQAAHDELRAFLSSRGARRAVRDLVARFDRMEALVAAHGLAAAGRPAPADAAKITAARAHWCAEEAPPGISGGEALGIVLGGILVVGGIAGIVTGIAAMSCPCVGLPILLLGMGAVGGGIALIVAMAKADERRIKVTGDADWFHFGPLDGLSDLEVGGRGLVTIDGVTCGPEGQPGTAAPEGALAPGLPIGALVGRVTGRPLPFVVGERTEVRDASSGVQVAINRAPGAVARGRYRAFARSV
jgi:hypothetical protein